MNRFQYAVVGGGAVLLTASVAFAQGGVGSAGGRGGMAPGPVAPSSVAARSAATAAAPGATRTLPVAPTFQGQAGPVGGAPVVSSVIPRMAIVFDPRTGMLFHAYAGYPIDRATSSVTAPGIPGTVEPAAGNSSIFPGNGFQSLAPASDSIFPGRGFVAPTLR